MFADSTTAQGKGLGSLTMPETLNYSVAMAIHTLWLVARADGLGLGWVSILDPGRMADIVDVPRSWTFIGHLCIGTPAEEDHTPVLQRAGWEQRQAPADVVIHR